MLEHQLHRRPGSAVSPGARTPSHRERRRRINEGIVAASVGNDAVDLFCECATVGCFAVATCHPGLCAGTARS